MENPHYRIPAPTAAAAPTLSRPPTTTIRHTESANEIVIVGAGLVGALMGMILSEDGYKVTIYERYEDIRSIPSMGRSINLVLTSRGMRAIRRLGKPKLVRDLNAMSTRVTGRVMHQTTGETAFQRYGKDDSEYNLSISRFELNKYLIAQAERSGVNLRFGHRMTRCAFDGGGARSTLRFEIGDGDSAPLEVSCDCPVLGADGAGSRLRYAMRDAGALTFEESFCSQGYKELMFPKGSLLLPEGLHIWPRRTHFLMALANRDGSFTGTFYADTTTTITDEESLESLARDPAAARAFFETHYPTAIPLLGGSDAIVRQLRDNPSGLLGTVYCDRFHYGRTLLLGDAGHAITPFFGQGTNSGFEDTVVLANLICGTEAARRRRGTTTFFVDAFAKFTKLRRDDTNAIAKMALENFVEMRERVGDSRFLRLKAVENALENAFPERFRSRYAMVCYGGDGNITYSAAYRLGEIQWDIVDALERGGGRGADGDGASLDLERADSLIRARLDPVRESMGVDLTKISHDVGGVGGKWPEEKAREVVARRSML